VAYIERDADRRLFNNLVEGRYCHVLAPPKTGKTELLKQVQGRLTAPPVTPDAPILSPFRCAYVSFKELIEGREDGLGGNRTVTGQNWYGALTRKLARDFGFYNIGRDGEYRRQRFERTPQEAFEIFIRDVLLEEISEEIVIFFDDIEEFLTLTFPNQGLDLFRNIFFSTLCLFHDQRASRNIDLSTRYERLRFVISGSALPNELVTADDFDPFREISQSITLNDFDLEQLTNNDEILSRLSLRYLRLIWDKTQGHPYLTMWFVNNFSQINPDLDAHIEHQIRAWRTNELGFLEKIDNKLKQEPNRLLLELYQSVNTNGTIPFEDCEAHQRLLLWGIVAKRSGYLEVHNPIFKRIAHLWFEPAQISSEPSQPQSSPESEGSASGSEAPPPDILSTEPPSNNDPAPSTGFWEGIRQGTCDFLDRFKDLAIGWEPRGLFLPLSLFAGSLSQILKNPRLVSRLWGRVRQFFGRGRQALNRPLVYFPLLLLLSALLFVLSPQISSGVAQFFSWVPQIFSMFKSDPNRFDSQANETLENFWKTDAVNQIEAMEAAIQNLDEWQKNERAKKETQRPLLALQQIYYNIREYNRLQVKGFKSFRAVTVSPEGAKIAATGFTGPEASSAPAADYLVFWNKDLNAQPDQKRTGQDGIYDFAFSEDGKYLATAGKDNTVYVWDVQASKLSQLPFAGRFDGGNEVRHVSFSPDGTRLAASSSRGQINIWNFDPSSAAPEPVPIPNLPSGSDLNIDFSISDRCLVTAGVPGAEIQVWNLSDLRNPKNISSSVRAQLPKGFSHPKHVEISPSGERIAFAGRSYGAEWLVEVREFQAKTCKLGNLIGSSYKLPFEPQGITFQRNQEERLAVMGKKGAFTVLQQIKTAASPITTTLVGQSDYVPESEFGSIQFYKKNQFITASQENMMRVWNVDDKVAMPKAESLSSSSPQSGSSAQLSIRRNENSRTTADYTTALLKDGIVTFYTNSLNSRNTSLSTSAPINAIASIDKNDSFMTGDETGRIEFWDWAGQPRGDQPIDFSKPIRAIGWHKNGAIAVATDGYLKLLKPPDPDNDYPISNIQQIQFSQDGKYLVLRNDKKFVLIDNKLENPLSSAVLIQDFDFYPKAMNPDYLFATLSSTGAEIAFKYLESGSKPISVKDIAILRASSVKRKPGEIPPTWNQVEFSPSGQYMAVGGEDEIQIWDVSSLSKATTSIQLEKKLINIFRGDWGKITSLSFRDDGNLIASGTHLVKVEIATRDEVKSRSCQWLSDYRVSNPDSSKITKNCQDSPLMPESNKR
jgi:WD40 repeat protein